MIDAAWLDDLQWNDQGLIPAIAQDEKSGDIPVSYTHLTLPTNREV